MIIIAVALLGVAHSHEGNGSNGFGEPNTGTWITSVRFNPEAVAAQRILKPIR